jgi:hypothetical protein
MLLDIHLGENAEYTVTYDLFDHRVAERIWQRFQETDFELVSRTQFYNLGETVEDVHAKLQHAVTQIRRLLPNINFVDNADLNQLHINFPELVEGTHGETRHWLSMFNYHLHHLEDITRNKNKRFLFAHQDDGEALELADYDLFSPTRLTNHLYMNYPHVGKHIMELYNDQDWDIPAHHIVTTSVLKNDCVAWFGRNEYHKPEYVTEIKSRIKTWLEPIKHKLPYALDDPRLAVGYICLGKLAKPVDLEQVAQFKYIHHIEVR